LRDAWWGGRRDYGNNRWIRIDDTHSTNLIWLPSINLMRKFQETFADLIKEAKILL
jgi:hypothetical protein